MTIRILLADDQALVRAGFRVIIDSAPDLAAIGEAANGQMAIAMTREMHPDLVLMDIRMPIMDGIEATRAIVGNPANATTRVLMLTTFDTDDYVVQALQAGASGFLLKDCEPTDLLDAIRIVAAGESLLSPRVTRHLIEQLVRNRVGIPTPTAIDLSPLTDRERDVLELVAGGLTNTEIADALFITIATAKTHVSNILAKLRARDRAQLVIIAYESGLVLPGQ